jgi:hypothetical protein
MNGKRTGKWITGKIRKRIPALVAGLYRNATLRLYRAEGVRRGRKLPTQLLNPATANPADVFEQFTLISRE